MTKEWITEMADLLRGLVADMPEGVPMGPCYMAFMQKGVSLDTFNQVVAFMVERGDIKVRNHCMYPLT